MCLKHTLQESAHHLELHQGAIPMVLKSMSKAYLFTESECFAQSIARLNFLTTLSE